MPSYVDRQLRCLVVTQWYAPEPAGVAQRIVKALRERDVQVTVLTGVPHYPTGRVAPGYRAWDIRTEEVDGVTVHRTPEFVDHSPSGAKRMVNYLSWAVSATSLGLRRFRNTDVALVYSSPATAGIPALAARWLLRVPYVVMVQDMWPDSIYAAGFDNRFLRTFRFALDAMCNAIYRSAAHICVISPGMLDLLTERGVPRSKMSLVYNWHENRVVARDERPERRKTSAPGATRLLYAGNHGPAQNLEPLIRAVAGRTDVHLTMVGTGLDKPALVEAARELNATNIEFHEPVAPSAIPAYIEACDAQIVSLRDDPLFAHNMPGKVQSIMASGRPVLAIATGDVAHVVQSAECGWTAVPGDLDSLGAALDEIAATPTDTLVALGERARRYYDTHMSQEHNASTLRAALAAAAQRPEKGDR